MKKENEYKITVLEGLSGVRSSVGMYVGSTGREGIHHLLKEIIDNSIDEYLAGYCNTVEVTLHKDGSVSVNDNGRGIPIYYMQDKKMTALEAVFTLLHAGGKFNKDNYEISGGLHGVGSSVVNALSIRMKVISRRENQECSIVFSKGKKIEKFNSKPYKGKSGTFVRFAPDPEIFTEVDFDSNEIKNRLRELSFLCKGLSIVFVDEINKIKEEFNKEDGLPEFIKFLAGNNILVGEPIILNGIKDDINTSIALQWTENNTDELCKYYTNNIPNKDGGTHMLGFKCSLTKSLNSYIEKADIPKAFKVMLTGDDVRECLIAVINIKHKNPKFSSQDKVKLISEDARAAVECVVSEKLLEYFDLNPLIAKKIVTLCVNAYKAREAARKAREAIRKTNIDSGIGVLPGKLADCSSKDPEECELFIVEGNSAGGSVKQARDRIFQAVLPLRGKVLNVEKTDFRKILKNEELTNIITAIGIGIGKNINVNKLRYNKIICASDADVDGAHIRALLLTFFFRQMPQLILNGNIYIARPPLYRIDWRGKIYYLRDDIDKNKFLMEKKITSNSNIKIQRFKGLGEMSCDQLWETTLNPETRILSKVSITDPLESEKVFSILMGEQVDLRKDFIVKNAVYANLDI